MFMWEKESVRDMEMFMWEKESVRDMEMYYCLKGCMLSSI